MKAEQLCSAFIINTHMTTSDFDINKLEETPHLLDILLEIEDVLDSLDVYVFRNWMNGEVAGGPVIRRYWVTLTLMYLANQMPDPRGGLRLLKHGVLVKFRKDQVDGEKGQIPVWYVELQVPRKLLNGMNDSETDYYDDEIDIDDIESAKDQGVDADSGVDQGGDQNETQ